MANKANEADLRQRGFQHVTSWEFRNGAIKPASLNWEDVSGWIYAFVAEGSVRYIGITTSVLRSRLDGYSYQINDRVGGLIRESLQAGCLVSIYGLKCPAQATQALGQQEKVLIRELTPDWNVRR